MKKPQHEGLTHPNSDSFQTANVVYSPAAAREECCKEFENILSLGVQSADCTNGISEAADSKDDKKQFDNDCMRSLLKVLRSWEHKQECKRRRHSSLAMEKCNGGLRGNPLAQLQLEVQFQERTCLAARDPCIVDIGKGLIHAANQRNQLLFAAVVRAQCNPEQTSGKQAAQKKQKTAEGESNNSSTQLIHSTILLMYMSL
ncbi:hypothetical protein O6H91_Y437700 [Diphasiastrum complanatum]|nr:hypothetical protein O6H91_Y437700 [Diphasiastrum complanatum]